MTRLSTMLSPLALALGLVIAQSNAFAATTAADGKVLPKQSAHRHQIQPDGKKTPTTVAMMMSDKQTPMCKFLKAACESGSDLHCQGYLDNCK